MKRPRLPWEDDGAARGAQRTTVRRTSGGYLTCHCDHDRKMTPSLSAPPAASVLWTCDGIGRFTF
jgi:hypothetical protein